jgi:hypothetical protein
LIPPDIVFGGSFLNCDMLLWRQPLVPEEDHTSVGEGASDCAQHFVNHRLGQIDTMNFRADRPRSPGEFLACCLASIYSLLATEPASYDSPTVRPYCGGGASEVLATRSAPPTHHVAT